MSESEKMTAPAPPAAPPQRSKTASITAIVAGGAAAGVGLVNVLSGSAGSIDVVLLAGGLLVAVVGLVRLL